MNKTQILREIRMREAIEMVNTPCSTCGHSEAAHTDNGRCKVTGCKNPTAKAHRANTFAPDVVRDMTREEIASLPGLLGRVAGTMVDRFGVYGFVSIETGQRVLIRVREA